MSVTFKQLLETSYIQVNTKIEELNRFIEMTRTLSIKTNSHIKIITSLVNELTDSDDILTLVDTELAATGYSSKYTHTTNTNKYLGKGTPDVPLNSTANHTVNVNITDKKSTKADEPGSSNNFNERNPGSSTNEQTRVHAIAEIKQPVIRDNEENILAQVLDSYKNENQKLWESLKKGQSDTDFIKGVFEKLLDSFTKQKTSESPVFLKGERDSLQPCTCLNCLKSMTLGQKPGVVPQQVSQSCYVPQHPLKRQTNCLHNQGSENFNEEESMRSLKEGGERGRRDENTSERNRRPQNESGINGMFKQYLELKKEFERMSEDKNRQVNDLTRMLEDTRVKSELLLKEVESLSTQKSVWENSTRDVMSQMKLSSEKAISDFSQKNKNMEREIWKLENQIETLNNENENLRKQVKDGQKWKNEEEFYKVKMGKMEADLRDLEANFKETTNRNAELINLLEKGNENRSKTRVTSETTTVDFNDDLLKCMYSQADYIETGMGAVFVNSIFKGN